MEKVWQLLHLDRIGEIALDLKVDCTKLVVSED